MTDDALVWRSAVDLAREIRDKKVSPVELTEALLARIEVLNPRLNAFCLVTADVARRAAREAEIAVMKGEPLGRLHGVPLSIKDVIFTRGVRTTGGSPRRIGARACGLSRRECGPPSADLNRRRDRPCRWCRFLMD